MFVKDSFRFSVKTIVLPVITNLSFLAQDIERCSSSPHCHYFLSISWRHCLLKNILYFANYGIINTFNTKILKFLKRFILDANIKPARILTLIYYIAKISLPIGPIHWKVLALFVHVSIKLRIICCNFSCCNSQSK